MRARRKERRIKDDKIKVNKQRDGNERMGIEGRNVNKLK